MKIVKVKGEYYCYYYYYYDLTIVKQKKILKNLSANEDSNVDNEPIQAIGTSTLQNGKY